MPTIIVDANIMVGALRGRSLPLIAALAEQMPVVTPVPQLIETQKTLTRLGHIDIDARMKNILDIVSPLPLGSYAHMEARARERLQPRGQPDWPLLAVALALDGHIWSRDADLFGTGVPLWFTRNIKFAAVEAV